MKEVIRSQFDDAYPIEAYVENFDGYGQNPVLLSKFGIQATNEVTLIISKERFETYISPLMKNESNVKLSTRPKEGDLIYFPLGDRLFEIKYVEARKPFYQLNNLYVYTLTCEVMDAELDQDINFSHLRGTVLTFLKTFFGDIPVRFRASYFPFTEPSAEVDVQWKGKWLEVMGCGMVDPKVLEKLEIDTEKWTGFAAGLGVERFCMVRHQIDDIRKFYTNDIRFLEQF